MYKLRDWITEDKLNIEMLCTNPHPAIIPILERHLDRIDQEYLSSNEYAMPLLEKHPDKIYWTTLSENPSAIHLLKRNRMKINGYHLGKNPNALSIIRDELPKINPMFHDVWKGLHLNPNPEAMEILKTDPVNIDWFHLMTNPTAIDLLLNHLDHTPHSVEIVNFCLNPHPRAIEWIEQKLHLMWINWTNLTRNPGAVGLLEKYPHRIDWCNLFRNPNALSLIEKNMDQVSWYGLSLNPNAMHLLEKNQEKVNWSALSKNPAIFIYDYEAMYQRNAALKEELMSVMFHPRNYGKFVSWGFDEFT